MTKQNIFELKCLPEYTDEAILEEIRRVAKLIPSEIITQKEFNRLSRVSTHTLCRRFGGWLQALTAASIGDRCSNQCSLITNKQRKQLGKGMSREDVLKELRTVANRLGKETITKDEFNRLSTIETGTVRKRFGSWNKALAAAGLRLVSHAHRYTNDECFENMLQVWTHYGRPPKHEEMNLPPSIVGSKAYVLRWGTWNKALHAFVEKANKDQETYETQQASELQNITSIVSAPRERAHAKTNELYEAKRRDIPLGLRFSVFKRDYFKCKVCGNSPATDHTCKLHVDHIQPFSKGGLTTIANLQTLCDRCNLGKGNRQ